MPDMIVLSEVETKATQESVDKLAQQVSALSTAVSNLRSVVNTINTTANTINNKAIYKSTIKYAFTDSNNDVKSITVKGPILIIGIWAMSSSSASSTITIDGAQYRTSSSSGANGWSEIALTLASSNAAVSSFSLKSGGTWNGLNIPCTNSAVASVSGNVHSFNAGFAYIQL